MKNKIKQIVESHDFKVISKILQSKKNQKLKEFILENTSFLNILPRKISFAERIYCVLNDIKEIPTCPVCSKPVKFNRFSSGYLKHCSKSCINKDKQIREKIKQTNLQKYGVEYGLQHKQVKEKRKQTNLQKYGVENVSQVETINDKKKQTFLKNFGVEYGKSDIVKEKIKKTNLQKYGVVNPFQIEQVKKSIKEKHILKLFKKLTTLPTVELICPLVDFKGCGYKYKWRCRTCGHIFEHIYSQARIPICRVCNPTLTGTSYKEKEIIEFLRSLGIKNIQTNDRNLIYPLELDIYLPEYNLAIEFNGLYWHSERNGKDKNYHLEKTLKCQEKGVTLIHIFEDEWIYKQEIIKSIIKHKLGKITYKIGARKLKIREIKNELKNKFLDKYHLQGSDTSKIRLGAFYKSRLVGVMTFTKSRFNKKYEWEISRFCTLNNFNFPGLASKFLNYFVKNYQPKSIITYADRRYSNGELYKKMGFKELQPSGPNYFYTKDYSTRESRIKYQKHKLKNILEYFNPELSEWDNMQINGFDRIWDCGNLVYFYQ